MCNLRFEVHSTFTLNVHSVLYMYDRQAFCLPWKLSFLNFFWFKLMQISPKYKNVFLFGFQVCLLLKVFLQSVEPCLRFIDKWVTSGYVCDPHNEFFIERSVLLLNYFISKCMYYRSLINQFSFGLVR